MTELVYEDLHLLAEKHLRRQFGARADQITLAPTALVHETFLRLVKQRKVYDSQGHFFAIATRVMLRVLMDYHRQRRSAKRWRGQVRVSLSGVSERASATETRALPLFVAGLKRLKKLDARAAEVAELRVLWGLTAPEIAETLEVSRSTVEREWRFARCWLAASLRSEGS